MGYIIFVYTSDARTGQWRGSKCGVHLSFSDNCERRRRRTATANDNGETAARLSLGKNGLTKMAGETTAELLGEDISSELRRGRVRLVVATVKSAKLTGWRTK